MINNSEYWSKRFEQLELSIIQNEDKYNEMLKEEYDKAYLSIQKEINNWFVRFAVNNQVSLAEAKKLLNSEELNELKWSIQDYIKYGQENGIDLIWKKELENASAKVHISRLEALQIQIQEQIEKLGYNENASTEEFIINSYKDNYYQTAYELQRGNNTAVIIQALDINTIKKLISKPWASDELTFSDRIWRNKKELINSLQTDLTQSIIRGEGPEKLIEKIAKEFKTSKNKAARLVMTESAFFGSASRKDCFDDLGVEKYEIVATLDSHTSEICRELDGTVHNMKDYKPGVTAPPFHVWCRSTTAPYFEDEFEFSERAARNTNGKTYYVPSNITYNEWQAKYINNPQYIKDKLNSKKLNQTIDNTVKSLPTSIQSIISDTTFRTNQGLNEYVRSSDIIHLKDDANKYETLHEIGHAVETKLDLYNNPKFLNILKDNITDMDIILAHTDSETFERPIDIIECEKFVSIYQGRIYNIDMYGQERYNNSTNEFNYKVLGEYFSEGFAAYFTNKKLLISKDKKLYNFIKEICNE